jgi:hypothetical protein
MAVEKATIKSALLALYESAKNNTMSEDAFADGMAGIITDAIHSGTVSFPIPVQVSVSTGTGGTTAAGTIV